MSQSAWDRLGLTPQASVDEIRRAYARLIKKTRPEDDPHGFQALVDARDEALNFARYAHFIQTDEDDRTRAEPAAKSAAASTPAEPATSETNFSKPAPEAQPLDPPESTTSSSPHPSPPPPPDLTDAEEEAEYLLLKLEEEIAALSEEMRKIWVRNVTQWRDKKFWRTITLTPLPIEKWQALLLKLQRLSYNDKKWLESDVIRALFDLAQAAPRSRIVALPTVINSAPVNQLLQQFAEEYGWYHNNRPIFASFKYPGEASVFISYLDYATGRTTRYQMWQEERQEKKNAKANRPKKKGLGSLFVFFLVIFIALRAISLLLHHTPSSSSSSSSYSTQELRERLGSKRQSSNSDLTTSTDEAATRTSLYANSFSAVAMVKDYEIVPLSNGLKLSLINVLPDKIVPGRVRDIDDLNDDIAKYSADFIDAFFGKFYSGLPQHGLVERLTLRGLVTKNVTDIRLALFIHSFNERYGQFFMSHAFTKFSPSDKLDQLNLRLLLATTAGERDQLDDLILQYEELLLTPAATDKYDRFSEERKTDMRNSLAVALVLKALPAQNLSLLKSAEMLFEKSEAERKILYYDKNAHVTLMNAITVRLLAELWREKTLSSATIHQAYEPLLAIPYKPKQLDLTKPMKSPDDYLDERTVALAEENITSLEALNKIAHSSQFWGDIH